MQQVLPTCPNPCSSSSCASCSAGAWLPPIVASVGLPLAPCPQCELKQRKQQQRRQSEVLHHQQQQQESNASSENASMLRWNGKTYKTVGLVGVCDSCSGVVSDKDSRRSFAGTRKWHPSFCCFEEGKEIHVGVNQEKFWRSETRIEQVAGSVNLGPAHWLHCGKPVTAWRLDQHFDVQAETIIVTCSECESHFLRVPESKSTTRTSTCSLTLLSVDGNIVVSCSQTGHWQSYKNNKPKISKVSARSTTNNNNNCRRGRGQMRMDVPVVMMTDLYASSTDAMGVDTWEHQHPAAAVDYTPTRQSSCKRKATTDADDEASLWDMPKYYSSSSSTSSLSCSLSASPTAASRSNSSSSSSYNTDDTWPIVQQHAAAGYIHNDDNKTMIEQEEHTAPQVASICAFSHNGSNLQAASIISMCHRTMSVRDAITQRVLDLNEPLLHGVEYVMMTGDTRGGFYGGGDGDSVVLTLTIQGGTAV